MKKRSEFMAPFTANPLRGFVALLFVCCLLLLQGQRQGLAREAEAEEDAEEQKEKAEKRPTFSCLYWEGSPPEQLYFQHGEVFHPIEFMGAGRTKDYPIPQGMTSFGLHRDTRFPVEGKPPYDLLARASIPQARKVLFVVIPFGDDEEFPEYKVVAMDDSLEAFPPGTFRFVNFVPESLFVKCGETTEKIVASGMTVIRASGIPNGGFVPFVIGNAKRQKIFGTRIFGQPSGRELVFISPPKKAGGVPRVKFISQIITLPPPKPTQS